MSKPTIKVEEFENLNTEFKNLIEVTRFLEYQAKLRDWLKKSPRNFNLLLGVCLRLKQHVSPLFETLFEKTIVRNLNDEDLFVFTQNLGLALGNKKTDHKIYKALQNRCQERFKQEINEFLDFPCAYSEVKNLLVSEEIKKTRLRKMRLRLTSEIQTLVSSQTLDEAFLKPLILNFEKHKTKLHKLVETSHNHLNSIRPTSSFERKCAKYENYLIDTLKEELEKLKAELEAEKFDFTAIKRRGNRYILELGQRNKHLDTLLDLADQMKKANTQEIKKLIKKFEKMSESLLGSKETTNLETIIKKLSALNNTRLSSFDSSTYLDKDDKISQFVGGFTSQDIFKPTPEQMKRFSPVRFFQRTPGDEFFLTVRDQEQKIAKRAR